MSPEADGPKPCPSTALAVLGAVNPDGAMLRCGFVAGHYGRHRFEMEWSDPEHDRTPEPDPRLIRVDLERYLASCRDDPDFRRRIRDRIDKDAEILKRLGDDA